MFAEFTESPEAELLDPEVFEAARQSRDPRFDGRFFVAVLTTGIYCRPVCPVRIPKRENVELYRTAAGAAAAGFRPCLRCRPESSPGTPAWGGTSWKVSKALQLIEQSYLDDNSVVELAAQLEIGPRQLRRLFQKHLGASPVDIAQTRRLHFAKKLIDETGMSMTEICFAAGFGSLRRFNAVFNKTYARTPSQLRDYARPSVPARGITMTLAYRPPYDWSGLLRFLAYRAIPGVEVVTDSTYSRCFRLDDVVGEFTVRADEEAHRLLVQLNCPDSRQLVRIIDRIRAQFDLRADSEQIERDLSDDSLLAILVKQFPGTRVAGCWDGFEVAVRAILGQQVTVKAATTLVGRLVARHGTPVPSPALGLEYTFPAPRTLVDADLDGLGITQGRIEAIRALARLVEEGDLQIDCRLDSEQLFRKLCAVKGIGEWTAHYIAMRALNDPNAFPHGDLILRRAAAASNGAALSPRQLLKRAEGWQPWRAYAVFLLWRHYADR